MNRWLVFSTLCLVFLSSHSVWGAEKLPTFSTSQAQDQDLSKRIPYFSLPSSETIPNQASTIPTWLDQFPAQHGVNPLGERIITGFYLKNDSQEGDWFVYPYGSVVEQIKVITFSQAGKVETWSGHGQNNEYDFHYGQTIFIEPNETKLVLVEFNSEFYFAPIKLLLLTSDTAADWFNAENITLLLALGICLALGIYNLFIYWGTSERLYLFYAISTLAYCWGWAHVFGVIQNITGSTTAAWIAPAYLFGAIFSAFFNIEFLQLNESAKRITLALKIIAGLSLICIPIAAYMPGIGILLASLSTSAVTLIGLFSGGRAWYQGYSPARYFVMALLAVTIPNMVGNLMNLGLLPALNVNIYLFGLIGNSLDSLLLAFALAEKVRLINAQNHELTTELERKVKKRTRALSEANRTLEVTNQQLVEASNAKGQFLANMSHEIRTPLTSIIGYADGVLLGDFDSSEQQRVIKIISENGNHLLNVINDILDISKIEADKLDFEFIPAPLFKMLAQMESLVSKRARDKGLAFHLDYQYPLPSEIKTDPTRFKQILFNLTNNAIKFTDQGYVGLSIWIDQDKLCVQVKDSGIGMTNEQLQNLFSPFSQADNSINRRFGGTGLGLSISQKLARGLGGKIEVSSVPNQGSQFTLSIALHITDSSQWIESVEDIWKSSSDSKLPDTQLPDFSGNRVLLADDHPSNRELVEILLKRMNIEVVTAENGKQALDEVINQRFDLILMDIHMPEMDGPSALKQIRSLGNYTPIIALTANNMRHEIDQYLHMGFADHLAKPLSRKHFVEKLNRFLTSIGFTQGLISEQDMVKLIDDYLKDLNQQLTALDNAWQHKKLEEVADIAHRIKGSAGSFGLTSLGDQFAQIEHSANEDDELALAGSLPTLVEITRGNINLPGVNIAQAIVNHGNDMQGFLNHLHKLLEKGGHELASLESAIQNHQLDTALVCLHKIYPELKKTAITQSSQVCEQLEKQIKSGELDQDTYQTLLTSLKQQLEMLQKVVLPAA